MDRVEKLLMLGVLGIALAIVAVLAFNTGPEAGSGDPAAGGAERSIVRSGGQEPGSRADVSTTVSGLLGGDVPSDVTGLETGAPDTGPKTGRVSVDGSAGTSIGSDEAGATPIDDEPEAGPASDASITPSMYWYDREYRSYIVQSGDTLDGILQRLCGYSGPKTRRRVEVLNEDLDLRALRVGQELLVPVEMLRGSVHGLGRPSESEGRADGPIASPVSSERTEEAFATRDTTEASAAASVDASGRVYVVQPGDSLWKIAAREVEARRVAGYVEKLEALNRDLLRGSADRIRVGMQLQLPQP